MTQTKECCCCKKILELSCFCKQQHGKLGVRGQCRECSKKYSYKFKKVCKVCHKRFTGCKKSIYCSKICCGADFKNYLDRNHKVSVSKLNELNPQWRGDDVGYASLHAWVRRKLKKPSRCICCQKVKPRDVANISGKYKRDLTDWEWLCRRCHMETDGRMMNLKRSKK